MFSGGITIETYQALARTWQTVSRYKTQNHTSLVKW